LRSSPEDFYYDGVADGGLEVIWYLVDGIHSHTNWGVGEVQENWAHDCNPLETIRSHKHRSLVRESLVEAATLYLELPYRAPYVERMLVEALIAVEMYGFGAEMFPDLKGANSFTRYLHALSSPFAERHVFLDYLISLPVNIAVYAAIPAVAFGIAPDSSVTMWIT